MKGFIGFIAFMITVTLSPVSVVLGFLYGCVRPMFSIGMELWEEAIKETEKHTSTKEPSMAEEVRTYNEWKALGFSVRKGATSRGRNERGICVFAKSQVTVTAQMTSDDSEIYGYYNPRH